MTLGYLIAKGNTAKVYLHENKIVKIYNDFLPDTESINEAKNSNTHTPVD